MPQSWNPPRLCFFSLFAARFSCRDFAGLFFPSFLLSRPLLIIRPLVTVNSLRQALRYPTLASADSSECPAAGRSRPNLAAYAKLPYTEAVRKPPVWGGPAVAETSHAVFLSYASQDAEAAQKICEALRAAGIEVWLDQSELRGGDAWDHKIRQQIRDCALFVPMISCHSQARLEGYFRREWKLAVDRTHDMADEKAFLVPVVIDDTSERYASVPDRFREVQWSRLPRGEASPAFVERVQRLLSPAPATRPPLTDAGPSVARATKEPVRASRSKATRLVIVAVIVAASFAYWALNRFWISRHLASPPVPSTGPTTSTPTTAAAFAPPPHSIAVLPFVNMSGDASQEYFSDGLTEELLNSLSRINALQVAARTSAFSFKGKNTDIGTIARKLNVGAVLEGSVRRSGHTIRITAQLINAVTGFHLWSETYDRDLGDVLKLQTEIATVVASALKVTLLGDESAKIEVGGTHNPAAFDAYLRASQTYWNTHNAKDAQAAIDSFTEAIRLDPDYALGYADRSLALSNFAMQWAVTHSAVGIPLDKAQADARKSIALAPNLGEGHLALAVVYADLLEFTPALEEYERALTLAPGNARALRVYGLFAVQMGRKDPGLNSLHRAVELDLLNAKSRSFLGFGLLTLRRYEEAIAAFKEALAVAPHDVEGPVFHAFTGLAYYLLGDLQNARTSCEETEETDNIELCLALTYNKLGRHADAEAMLAKLRASNGDTAPVFYAMIYAQWGNTAQALAWLEKALSLRDTDLGRLKTESLLDPLRQEPRFQAVMRELKFPQ
jgi:TolB-like protein/Flp pilus assembly protein TadD